MADLHSDSLLWQRDLLVRNEHGHVDVPRMLAGNVALQGFTIVSSVPIGINFLSNPRPSLLTDSVTLLAAGSVRASERMSLPAIRANMPSSDADGR